MTFSADRFEPAAKLFSPPCSRSCMLAKKEGTFAGYRETYPGCLEKNKNLVAMVTVTNDVEGREGGERNCQSAAIGL